MLPLALLALAVAQTNDPPSPRGLNDAFHPWTPPATRAAWEEERSRIRRQILVAAGLWPLPERSAPRAWRHGRIERETYTVEKVIVESLPGHFVTGSLYRPRGAGPFAAVLSPHGHWRDGRFSRATDAEVEQLLASGAEELSSAARSHLQARCVHLARMGCVVFHYDMVGYASSTALDHRAGFSDAAAIEGAQSLFGLQTWNSIRALDFLAELPEVDADRIGVTGASGGGTQTFLLCAIDERPAAAFPAVMVSTAMQGGCVCENAPYLRLGLNNVAFAACFAPRPMALSGADDWTVDFAERGFPELRQVYALYDAEERVEARVWKEYPHNFNRHARAMMYAWFHEHLGLPGEAPQPERAFDPLTRDELDVWKGFEGAAELATLDAGALRASWEEGLPRRANVDDARAALATMLDLEGLEHDARPFDGELFFAEPRDPASVEPISARFGGDGRARVALWVEPRGATAVLTEAPWSPAVRELTQAGWEVATYFPQHGSAALPVHGQYGGYTWGYNRPLVLRGAAEVVRAVQELERSHDGCAIDLVGTGAAGAWVELAAHALGERVERVVIEHRTAAGTAAIDDPLFLPNRALLAPLIDAPPSRWQRLGALSPDRVPSLLLEESR